MPAGASPCYHTNLQPLKGLTKLQSLIIEAPGANFRDPDPDDTCGRLAVQQFPGLLTSLTELWLPLSAVHDIRSVSTCVGLRDLRLQAESHPRHEWGSHEWAALAQLTSLINLHVALDLEDEDQIQAKAFYGVLGKLKELRSVGVSYWVPSFVLQLCRLTQVTAVRGVWEPAEYALNARMFTCPHIKEVWGAMFAPFPAFPNLVMAGLSDVCPDDLADLSCYCTGLQKLVLDGSSCSFVESQHEGDDATDSRAAFRSLARLQHLTHLELLAPGDAELLAFTTAAAALRTPQLRCLHVRGDVTVHALMQLQSVRGLEEVCVHVSDSVAAGGTFTVDAVRVWLVGLAAVPKVCLVVRSAEQQGVFDAARQWAAEMELPLPAVLKVSCA